MTEPARRAQILEAADRLLRHYGAQKTTVSDVAREAGVGVGSVYLEFPSKEAIVEELSRSRHREVLDAMRAASSAGRRPFSERFTRALDARLEAFFTLVDAGTHACDLVHCVSAAVKAAQASFQHAQLALVADLLRRGAEAGELEAADPEAVAGTVLRAYVSFSLPSIAGCDRGETRAAQAAMHQLTLRGILVRVPPRLKRA
ncbi:MAG: TetR/AcrR family transcriptional regulator [Byssovorax sp.]